MRKTIVLDFYGVPGSGKTTISHEIAEKYRADNKLVQEPSFFLDHTLRSRARKIKKLQMTFWVWLFRHKVYLDIEKLVKKNGYILQNGKASQIVNLATKLYAINRYDGSVDYLIFDEGLAQAAISLSVNSDLPADENLNLLLSIMTQGAEIHFIEVPLCIEEALKRISKRNNNDTRVEALKSEKEKIDLMKRYETASKQINHMRGIEGRIKKSELMEYRITSSYSCGRNE